MWDELVRQHPVQPQIRGLQLGQEKPEPTTVGSGATCHFPDSLSLACHFRVSCHSGRTLDAWDGLRSERRSALRQVVEAAPWSDVTERGRDSDLGNACSKLKRPASGGGH